MKKKPIKFMKANKNFGDKKKAIFGKFTRQTLKELHVSGVEIG